MVKSIPIVLLVILLAGCAAASTNGILRITDSDVKLTSIMATVDDSDQGQVATSQGYQKDISLSEGVHHVVLDKYYNSMEIALAIFDVTIIRSSTTVYDMTNIE
jgi:hypothetical protein